MTIRQFDKDYDETLSANFRVAEFHCHCVLEACKKTYVSEELIEGLQALRDACGPLEILSGFRCNAHNKNVGGRPKSQHLMGIAADVKPLEGTIAQLERAAKRILAFSQGGIGIYSSFIHVDVRGYPARWKG